MSRSLRGVSIIAAAAAVLTLAASVAVPASAHAVASDRYGNRPGPIYAESRWGNGSITGVVRVGRVGFQVRLPRGTWIDCVRSCSETLRRNTVDFWESHGPNAPDKGPSYFYWERSF